MEKMRKIEPDSMKTQSKSNEKETKLDIQLYETKKYSCLEYDFHRNENLFMTLCGVEQCQPGYMFFSNKREGYHLHVIMEGKGTFHIGNECRVLHFGDMFITKPEEVCWYIADEQDPWSYCWITFDGSMAAAYANEIGFTDGMNWQECAVEPQRFYHLVRQILEKNAPNLANELLHIGLTYQFLSLAMESHVKLEKQTRSKHEYTPDMYVKRALEYMKCNYSSVKINDVANYIGINRSYLTSIFKKKTGVSPQEYLLQYRMQIGCEMLQNSQMSIQEIAAKIGYEDPLTFSKIFKKIYGVSPRKYRMSGNIQEG